MTDASVVSFHDPPRLPAGFRAAGVHAGLKADGAEDMACFVSDVPAAAAALFTRNHFPGAPVLLGRERIRSGRLQAVVVNAKNSNVATGAAGLADAREMARLAGTELNVPVELVLVGSTGVIGRRLPMDLIRGGIKGMASRLSSDPWPAARGMMTTDTHPKVVSVSIPGGTAGTPGDGVADQRSSSGQVASRERGGTPDGAATPDRVRPPHEATSHQLRPPHEATPDRVRPPDEATPDRVRPPHEATPHQAATLDPPINGPILTGVAKGAGMIAPNMATMLVYLFTDARLEAPTLERALRPAADESFELLSVDTDTSTSDMVVLLANGRAGPVAETDFRRALLQVCGRLAAMVARDGEGATKLLRVTVEGAAAPDEARRIARAVVDSPLVKTMAYGADPNVGRILMAVGKCVECRVRPERVDAWIQGRQVVKSGEGCAFSEPELRLLLAGDPVEIRIRLGVGGARATALGCDLTEGYIEENAAYASS